MKYLFNFILVLIITKSFSQNQDPPLAFGSVDKLYSKIIKEDRKIFVYYPRIAEHDTLSGNKRYPVVYLLDGEGHFEALVAMIRQLCWTGILPEMIIVGISNTDRTRDLTPSRVSKASAFDKTCGWNDEDIQTSGGGENFAAFIEKELVPHIDSIYPTAPYRLFIGHSFGGITVMNMLLNHPGVFNSYIAIDPAFFWDNQKILKQAEKDLEKNKFEGKSLFLAIANLRPSARDNIPLEKDSSVATKLMSFTFRLKDALTRNKQNKLRSDSKYYKEDSHGSVPLIAEYDGLRFIFDFYKFPQFLTEDLMNLNLDSVYTAHYKNVSVQMGYSVSPPQSFVGEMAYFLLSKKKFDKAYSLFQMNRDNYPDNWYVYNCLGDYYKEAGEKQKAIEYYTKALSFFDHPETKNKIEKLKTSK